MTSTVPGPLMLMNGRWDPSIGSLGSPRHSRLSPGQCTSLLPLLQQLRSHTLAVGRMSDALLAAALMSLVAADLAPHGEPSSSLTPDPSGWRCPSRHRA